MPLHFEKVEEFKPSECYLCQTISLKKNPSGWVILSGQMAVKHLGIMAYLVMERPSGTYRCPIPVLPTGQVFELVTLPDDLTGLYCVVDDSEQLVSDVQLTAQPVSYYKRTFLMFKRVLSTYQQLPRTQRFRAGLFWYSPWLSLMKSYNTAMSFRYLHASAPSYLTWQAQCDRITNQELSLVRQYSEKLQSSDLHDCLVLVKLDEQVTNLMVQATLESINASLFKPRQVVLVCDYDSQVESCRFDFHDLEIICKNKLALLLNSEARIKQVVWVTAGYVLAEHALTWFVAEAVAQPDATLIYSDHDQINSSGERINPQFKPDWSAELAMSCGYPGEVLCVPVHVMQAFCELELQWQAYALILFAGALQPNSVKHIPAVLWHEPEFIQPLGSANLDADVLSSHLQRVQRNARVSKTTEGFLRVHDQVDNPIPLVSIIIPTRDYLDFLKPCVTSLLENTAYAAFEILIMDNQSSCPDTLAFFDEVSKDDRVNVIAYDHPFNYSAINNFAAKQAKGKYLCLLNNDTQVITPEWLDEMVSVLQVSGVGAVGCKLFYADNTVQHAGDLIGGRGCAHHLHSYLEADEPGYMSRAILRQEVSAVTGACLLTPKDLYLELGGLNQKHLAVAFNDVDYCLRVNEAGYRVVFTPYAHLYHYESVSRGKSLTRQQRRRAYKETQYMRKRWEANMQNDPFYNPNLNYMRCDFSLNPYAVVKRPWD